MWRGGPLSTIEMIESGGDEVDEGGVVFDQIRRA